MSEIAQQADGTESGLYRRLVSSRLFPAAIFILWTIGCGLCAVVWNDNRDLNKRVTTLEAQREGDQKRYDELREAIKDIQADIKELLREVRK